MKHGNFWTCEKCNEILSDRRSYIRHMKSQHQIQGDKSLLQLEEYCRFCEVRGKCKVCVRPTKVKITKGFEPRVVLKVKVDTEI